MGAILERCGLAEDMLDSMGQLFGPIRGGLGYSVIIVGFILGAITGTVAAQVIAMALISLPVMMRYGYNMRYIDRRARGIGHDHAAGAAVAGADRAGRPARQVGRRHVSRRLGPVAAADRAVRRLHLRCSASSSRSRVPAVPKDDARRCTGWALWTKCLWGIIPSAVLIFVVLGTMMLGLATPTEAGAMGAVGAIVLAAIASRELEPHGAARCFVVGLVAGGVGRDHRHLGVQVKLLQAGIRGSSISPSSGSASKPSRIPDLRDLIKQGYEATMRLTAMVVFILIGSTCFSVVFQGVDGGRWLEHHADRRSPAASGAS